MERRNNLVIFGWSNTGKVGRKEVAEFFREELGMESNEECIEEVGQPGPDKKMIWVKMRKPEDKKKIMERKSKLKGKKIFIENDRTKKEREEQKELKRRAWIAKNQGAKNVKVGFGRMWVEGVAFRWDGVRKVIEPNESEGGKGGIRLVFWNVAGIRNKDKEFWEFLKQFDVIGLTET
ncbi:GSCOCG00012001001-RA-CDS, partial [Cotesia congregata]